MKLKDNDGHPVQAGDIIFFCYGIPLRWVFAKVIQRGKSLIALTPEENPKEINLRSLRKHVGAWYKYTG